MDPWLAQHAPMTSRQARQHALDSLICMLRCPELLAQEGTGLAKQGRWNLAQLNTHTPEGILATCRAHRSGRSPLTLTLRSSLTGHGSCFFLWSFSLC